MIKFATLAGNIPRYLSQFIDIDNPAEDLRWQTMTEPLFCKDNDNTYKLEFIINDIIFISLYETITHALLLTDDIIIVTVTYSTKPKPPLYPSISFTNFHERDTELDDLPTNPISFLEWYNYEDKLRNYLNETHDSNVDFRYQVCTLDNIGLYSFDTLNSVILIAIHKYVQNPNNKTIWLRGWQSSSIAACHRLSEHNITEMENIIFNYLITLPEWVEYFTLWRAFWRNSSEQPKLSTLAGNQNYQVYDIRT